MSSWLPFIGTLAAAAVAISSALLVELHREHRRNRTDRFAIKRDIYARYLADHAHMRAQFRVLAATPNLSDDERSNQARSAYTICFASHYELEVLASQAVLSRAQELDSCARAVRDVIIGGANTRVQGTPVMQDYINAMTLVRAAMRKDLAVADSP